jgi:serine/threonine protein kinase
MSTKEEFSANDLVMEKKIGKGSFGYVFCGMLKNKGIKVAIKRINKKEIYKYGEYLINAFFKELDCMKKCECENSVKFYTNFESENNYNIIMELCDSDLSSELAKHPNGFNLEEVRYIMSQLNNAFKKLNENNLIHRDLKLGNILVTYTDEKKTKFIPKLCDYGFSKELNKTTTETHLGTPATMAPEIMKNQKYDSKVDLWSVGVIIYQLLFNKLPYPGYKEEAILEKIKNKVPYKQPEDPKLRDLLNKLLVEDPNKRLSWEEYFNHPFFATEQANSSINNTNNFIKNQRYTYINDFDFGFKNDSYKCFIALDKKRNKKVLIKSYKKEFIKSHEIYYNQECDLNKAFKGNEYIFELINIFADEKTRNLVYDYIDIEILSSYIKHHDFTEEELQKINKELFEHIFIFNECNFKSFIFISIYSFGITKEGKPILFDFGLNKFLLSPDEFISYYSPNKKEIAHTIYPTKTNVMNYGITLLKCFYGNDLKIKINNISFDLPEKKKLSNKFCKFLSKCLYRDISRRYSWLGLQSDSFLTEVTNIVSLYKNTSKEGLVLLDDNKLKIIFESLNYKYDLINKYYDTIELIEKTQYQYIKEIEIFLTLTLFEQLIILNIFDREENKPFTSQQEISFITINKNDNPRFSLNLANPIISNLKIINLKNNEIVSNFIKLLKEHITKLKEITLKIHKITKSSLFKGKYQEFLKNFISIFESSNFHNYFFFIVKRANNYFQEKKYEKVYKEIPIAEYICECILFVKESIFDSSKEKIHFNVKELIEEFNKIFEDDEEKNKVEISIIKINEARKKYVIISFLGVLFRYFINSMDFNQSNLKKTKDAIDGLLDFYPSLMKLLVDSKKKLNKNY